MAAVTVEWVEGNYPEAIRDKIIAIDSAAIISIFAHKGNVYIVHT